jgi:hypothetical protein
VPIEQADRWFDDERHWSEVSQFPTSGS